MINLNEHIADQTTLIGWEFIMAPRRAGNVRQKKQGVFQHPRIGHRKEGPSPFHHTKQTLLDCQISQSHLTTNNAYVKKGRCNNWKSMYRVIEYTKGTSNTNLGIKYFYVR